MGCDLLLEDVGAGGDVGLANDDRVTQSARLRSGIGLHPPVMPDGLSVNRRGAVLANHAVRSLVEPDRAANLAGVKHRRNFAVGLLVQPEANRDAILPGLEAVKVAIGDLGQRNTDLAVAERSLR